MSKFKNLFESMYVKVIFIAVTLFIGISSGIYVGYAYIGANGEAVSDNNATTETHGDHSNGEGIDLDEQFVNFGAGDLFPLESYVDKNNNKGNFENLLQNKATIFLFVSLTCTPCHDMLLYWNLNIQDKLNKDVQVVVCLREKDGEVPVEFMGLLENKQLVFFDGDHWSLQYDMAFWPTIIAVDESGFVRKVQLGFENYIHYDIANYFFVQNK